MFQRETETGYGVIEFFDTPTNELLLGEPIVGLRSMKIAFNQLLEMGIESCEKGGKLTEDQVLVLGLDAEYRVYESIISKEISHTRAASLVVCEKLVRYDNDVCILLTIDVRPDKNDSRN